MRSPVAMFRIAPLVLVVGFIITPAAALAAPKSPAPSASPQLAADETHVGGVVEGRVTSVDYARGVISVNSPSQGMVDVSTMPTTSVQSDDPGYHTLSDVSRGSKVQIFISKTAGKLVAQIIRLLKH
jgi:hypothetical protein